MAQTLFVGREREQRHYQELLNGASAWMLVITGQGGNGKSALLRRFAEQTPHDTAIAMLDFTSDVLCVDALTVLERLADQLEPHCNKQAGQAFKKALQQGRKELAANKQMSETIIASEHGTVQGNVLTMNAATSEQRRQVRESVRMALFALLDTLRPTRLVMMLDTSERLLEGEGFTMGEVGKWVMHDLIPGFYARLHQKHCRYLAVISSRIHPQLEAIDQQEQRHLVLPMLEKPAVDEYLQLIGMQDVTLRQRVYDLTHGHALCVSIIGTLWQKREEQPFTLADLPLFKEQFTERALLRFVGERVLDKRLKTPFRELTRYGVLLRSFNLPMLQAVFYDLLPELEALECLHQLIRYPYIESLGNYRYAFHDLLHEIQAREIREQEPKKWQEYHKRALDHLTQVSPRSPDRYYHALAYDEKRGVSDWEDAVQEAQLRGEREFLGELLQAAHDGTLELSPATCASRAYWQGSFYYYGSDMQAALASYEQALTLFRQVGDRLGEANVRKAMGDVQQFRKDMQAALASYEQALTLFRQVGDRLGEANCYLAQGRIALEQESYPKALTLHTEAYQLYQRIQDAYSQARLLYYRSFVYEAMDEQHSAILDVEKALVISLRLNLPFTDLLRQRLEVLQEGSS